MSEKASGGPQATWPRKTVRIKSAKVAGGGFRQSSQSPWTMSPPGLAREYLSHPAFDDAVDRLGTWVLTAARVPRPVFEALTRRGVHVTQAFGMSEGLFLFTPLDAIANLRAETVGAPIAALDEIRVLRPGTQVEVAEGETGELAARGPYTIRGYLAAPDRNREAFTAEGFYRSGNLVRARRCDGVLGYSIEGRVKDLIDRGGEKVNAEEVELLVGGSPRRGRDGLVAIPTPDWTSAAAPTSCPRIRRTLRHSSTSALTWRLRAWPSTSGLNASNSSTCCREPRSGRSPR